MREFLARNRLPHQWLDVDTDPDVDRLVAEFGLAVEDLPVVITGSRRAPAPTPGAVAQHLGMTIESIPDRCFDLVVVGAGPGGAGGVGVRRVRGAEHAHRRVDRARRAGGDELAHRELPRLPAGRLRHRADEPRDDPGAEVRRAAHHPVRGRRPERGRRPPRGRTSPTARSSRAAPSSSRPARTTGGCASRASRTSRARASTTPRPRSRRGSSGRAGGRRRRRQLGRARPRSTSPQAEPRHAADPGHRPRQVDVELPRRPHRRPPGHHRAAPRANASSCTATTC